MGHWWNLDRADRRFRSDGCRMLGCRCLSGAGTVGRTVGDDASSAFGCILRNTITRARPLFISQSGFVGGCRGLRVMIGSGANSQSRS